MGFSCAGCPYPPLGPELGPFQIGVREMGAALFTKTVVGDAPPFLGGGWVTQRPGPLGRHMLHISNRTHMRYALALTVKRLVFLNAVGRFANRFRRPFPRGVPPLSKLKPGLVNRILNLFVVVLVWIWCTSSRRDPFDQWQVFAGVTYIRPPLLSW